MSEQLASPDDLRSIAALCRSRDFQLWAERLEALADQLPVMENEIAAWRRAFVEGDGPMCEDVCLRECLGVCGV